MANKIENLKPLKMYRGGNKLFAPLSVDDKLHGSVIYLLTPNIQSSINMINSNMVITKNWYKSYYVDKSVNAVLKANTNEIKEFVEYRDAYMDSINESKLSSKDRKELDTSDFGIPETRSYPMPDEEHVRQAIRMFNHCPQDKEKQLAKNIIKKIKKFDMRELEVGDDNRFSNYYKTLKETQYTPFTSGYCDDYRFYYYTDKTNIQKALKKCKELLPTKLLVDINDYTNKIGYMSVVFDDENNLCGFGILSKDDFRGKEFVIWLDDDKYDDANVRAEVYRYMIYNIRGVYATKKQPSNRYIKVISLNDDKNVMTIIKTSYTREGSILDYAIAKNLTGGHKKDKHLCIYIKEELPKDEEEKVTINMSENAMNPTGLRSGDKIFLFGSDLFNEDFADATLRKYMYNDRMRQQKDLISVYDHVKSECPTIKYTKVNFSQYNKLNLYFDISYYHNIFLEKNGFTGERGVNLYVETLSRLMNNKNIDADYSVKTIFIPVCDYFVKDGDIFDYKKSINPISIITRLMRRGDSDSLKRIFKNNNIIFFGTNSYFLMNFSNFDKTQITRFKSNITNMINKAVPVEDDMVTDTPEAIVLDIVDKIDTAQNTNLYGALGKLSKTSKETSKTKDKEKVIDNTTPKSAKKVTPNKSDGTPKSKKEIEKEITDEKKKEVVEIITQAANTSSSSEEAIEKLENSDDNEYIAALLKDISDEESTEMKASATRKARINNLQDDFKKMKVKGQTVESMINPELEFDNRPLEKTSANINSINNDQWDNLQFKNFEDAYNVDDDIMAILDFFSTRTVPVGIRDVKVEDTTTPEDLKETWTVQCEDINGNRFQLKFDIPKFKNNRMMRLRGNDKTINGQLMNLPIIKTESDTAQITTNYNKIFFYAFGSALGKSNICAGKVVKALQKYTGKAITYRSGSCALSCMKYEVPIDYADLGGSYSYIQYKGTTIYFDQDEIREKYNDIIDLKKGMPIAYDSLHKGIIYTDPNVTVSRQIANILCEDKEFAQHYEEAKPSVKYAYSQASILSVKIPVVVICAYCEGLIKTLNRAQIDFKITDKREKIDNTWEDIIRFKDGYLTYKLSYESSMFMNGLKECNTEDYSIKDINTKTMWTEQLDHFGGRIKADGLDNFYDLMFDPITNRVCNSYKLTSEFCQALVYASDLLTDTGYNKHTDLTGNRLRTNEIVAGYTYKILSKAYADYRIKLKKTGKATMTIKQSAIIDAILADNTCSDLSTANDLNYAECANTVSFKGLSGLNSDRSYSLEKRIYSDSMQNILGMSTGFAGTVGVTRVATTNAMVNGKRGYIGDTEGTPMNDVNTMTVFENMTPMCTTHDDPFREAMSYIQNTKHNMRVQGGDPMLITNGMDDAISEFTPDYFSFNAKDDGRIIEKNDDHIVVQYKNGSIDYVDLNNHVYKNSDGGFYTSIKLKTADKLGTTVKRGQIIAYDPLSYSTNVGYDDSATYQQGTMAKVAIITSDKGFEDSCVVSSYISDALSSEVVMKKEVNLSKDTNVFDIVKVGQPINTEDTLMIIQNTFEDNDVNVLLKNLVDDEDTVTSLGRIPIKSHNTGRVEDIQIYRTCELDEMSPSLKKIVTEYEKNKNRVAKQIAKYDETKAKEYTVGKLEQTGKLKNVEDGVLIEFFISYKDDFSVGDKLIFLGAQKGVAKEVIQEGQEPTSSYRPEEPIDAIASMVSFDKRMCCAPLQYTMATKGLVELDRQVKDIMGIKQDYTIRHKF